MKKIFAGIAATITIALVIISLAYILISPTSSAAADIEANPAVAEWQLTVTGLVENPLNVSWTEIVAMPTSTVNAALICVDFPGNVVAEGNWTGVKLRVLLEAADFSPEAIKVGFYASDGYSTDLTLEKAISDNVILAYEKDGEPLNDLRLVVPGKWGYKWISQLTSIELLDYDFLGFWESRGYSDEANVSMSGQKTGELQPLPKVDVPSPSSTTPPATSPSPSPSQPSITSPAPSQQPTPKAMSSEGFSFPTEAVYATAALIVAVLVTAALILKKKIK